jgi:predicted O-methyltransferase YrrM
VSPRVASAAPVLHPHNRAWVARHPFAALSFMLGDKQPLHRLMILRSAKFLLAPHMDAEAWQAAILEIERADFVPMRADSSNQTPLGNELRTTLGKWLYCAVRALKPAVVIETGVASGVSSWVILNALRRNGRGTLRSIDLPNHDTNRNYLVGAREPGWVVPDVLREMWSLQLGSARELLPAMVRAGGTVDLFFHDSDHSYDHMKFEFDTVLPSMRSGALIVSDDIQTNEAFAEFTASHGLRSVVFTKGGCAVVGETPAGA